MTDATGQQVMEFTQGYKNTDHDSSKLADEKMVKSRLKKRHCFIVLNCLRLHNGSTSKELAEHCTLDRHEVARRLPDLEANGEVKKVKIKGKQITWWIRLIERR